MDEKKTEKRMANTSYAFASYLTGIYFLLYTIIRNHNCIIQRRGFPRPGLD